MVSPQTFVLAGTRGAPTRARIVDALGDEPRTADDLALALGVPRGTVRDHLPVLRENGLVKAREGADPTAYVAGEAVASETRSR